MCRRVTITTVLACSPSKMHVVYCSALRLAKVFEERDKAASVGLQLERLYPGTPEYQQYLSEQ